MTSAGSSKKSIDNDGIVIPMKEATEAPKKSRATLLAVESKKEEPVRVTVPEIQIGTMRCLLVGLSPLITDNGASSIPKLRSRQSGEGKIKKGAREPDKDYEASRYLLDNKDAFPALGITKSMQTAAWRFTDSSAKGLFTVKGELLHLKGTPKVFEKNVRNAGPGRVADLRYRAMYDNWSIEVEIEYLANFITLDQIVNLLRLAGRAVGIGNWRPEKGGPYGTFDVASLEKGKKEKEK